MNSETFIEKPMNVQPTVEQLLAQLQTSEHDKFAAHLYQSRRQLPVSLRPRRKRWEADREVSDLEPLS